LRPKGPKMEAAGGYYGKDQADMERSDLSVCIIIKLKLGLNQNSLVTLFKAVLSKFKPIQNCLKQNSFQPHLRHCLLKQNTHDVTV